LIAKGNRIKTFPNLKGMPSITHLDLSNNQISELNSLIWKDGNKTGWRLEIQANPIDCAAQKKNLEYLSIMWPNILTDCPGFYRDEP
jgi:Leucine-rich repeat (LRR) protein